MMRIRMMTAVATLAVALAAPAWADDDNDVSPAQLKVAEAHYAPYLFLMGDWETAPPPGGPGMYIRQSFRWGPGHSYIRYTTYTRPGLTAPEHIHFDGIMIWNGAQQSLDFLFALEPGGGGQEQGTIHAEPDGTILREVTLTQGDGRKGRFRQTFRQTGPNGAVTSLMRQTASGWEPNFPGSDSLAMTRRPG